jgi:hypothetical protein
MLAEAAGYAWPAISTLRESWRPGLNAWDDLMMGGNWRVVMTAEVERLRAELPSAPSRAAQATVQRAAGLLDAVERSVNKPPSIRGWWTGEQSLLASLQVHEAEAELAATLPDEIALARLPQALADARRDIDNDDNAAVREATSLYFETYAGGSSAARPPHRLAPLVLSQLLQSRYDAVDKRQDLGLAFRNRAIRLTAVILVSLLASVAVAAGAQLHLSPGGRSVTASTFPSAWLTVLCVIIFGLIGGLISAIPGLARPVASHDPYGLVVYQAALKPPLGGLLAVAGCLALQSGALPGVTGVTSLTGLLFWAIAFGASQQAVTRMLDAQVGNLLSPPGEATLPRLPVQTADLGPSAASSTSPNGPQRTFESDHSVESVQTTASGTRRERLSEHESRSATQE